MKFDGKSVLVTGASRGIGKATAQAFLDAGARVAVNGRSEASVNTALASLTGAENAVPAPGDVATAKGCEQVVQQALDQLGGIDVLVNNAGVFARATVEDTDEAVWDYVLDANLKGTFFCTRAALPALKEARGSVVNVASESGLNGYAESSAYCASKGAVVNLTRALAIEFAPLVRVNCVCPGAIETDMARAAFALDGDQDAGIAHQKTKYPVQRIGTSEEVAVAILYLASDHAGFVNGVALPMEGGATAGG